jgi:DNA-binding CsgD family transcriptional regulator
MRSPAALSADRLAHGGDVRQVAAAVAAADWEPSARGCDLLLDGLALLTTEGYTAGAPALKQALRAFRAESLAEEDELRWLWLACHVARALGDDVAWDELTERQVELARRAGALAVLPVALDDRIHADVFCGRLALARSLVAEADAILEATRSHAALRGAILLANCRGDENAARALMLARRQDVMRRGEGLWLAATGWGDAVRYNGLGRYDDALAAAERASEDAQGLGAPMWLLADLIEAAARAGKADRATVPLERLTEIAEASGTNWALGLLARSRALLGQGAAAEPQYSTAIERLGATRVSGMLARTHLVYGEWLRRENRRVDAREQLRVAHDVLTETGMEAFAERARRELLATGETVRKRSIETLDELTPQEVQIARLAAGGQTNSEIGAQLFLSPRTVEWHLGKVFGKLGIGSRRELRAALDER